MYDLSYSDQTVKDLMEKFTPIYDELKGIIDAQLKAGKTTAPTDPLDVE